MPSAGDTFKVGLPIGGFGIKRNSAVLNKPLLEAMDAIYSDDKKYRTTPGNAHAEEKFFTPGEVDFWGRPMLNAINDSSDGTSHQNIDALIVAASLNNMMPMASGGTVGENYQDGKDVSKKASDGGLRGVDLGKATIIDPRYVLGKDYETASTMELALNAADYIEALKEQSEHASDVLEHKEPHFQSYLLVNELLRKMGQSGEPPPEKYDLLLSGPRTEEEELPWAPEEGRYLPSISKGNYGDFIKRLLSEAPFPERPSVYDRYRGSGRELDESLRREKILKGQGNYQTGGKIAPRDTIGVVREDVHSDTLGVVRKDPDPLTLLMELIETVSKDTLDPRGGDIRSLTPKEEEVLRIRNMVEGPLSHPSLRKIFEAMPNNQFPTYKK